MRLLLIHDPRALHSVLVKDQDLYPKRLTPSQYVSFSTVSFGTSEILIGSKSVLKVLQGPGIFSVIDKFEHRRQRKLLNPVFSTAHLRDMTDIFYSVVHKVSITVGTEVACLPRVSRRGRCRQQSKVGFRKMEQSTCPVGIAERRSRYWDKPDWGTLSTMLPMTPWTLSESH